MKILLIEDHHTLRDMMVMHLTRSGHVVDVAATLSEGMYFIKLQLPDAIILDLGLPDGEGLTLLKHLRSRKIDTPVLIVTARDALSERLNGLNLGADDYLIKPFNIDELEARLRAVSRRAGKGLRTEVLTYANVRFDLTQKTVTVNDQALMLPRKEALLLEAFLNAGTNVLIKEVLEERLYGFNESVTLNAVEALVSRLRRRLSQAEAQLVIRTIRGIGYQLAEKKTDEGS